MPPPYDVGAWRNAVPILEAVEPTEDPCDAVSHDPSLRQVEIRFTGDDWRNCAKWRHAWLDETNGLIWFQGGILGWAWRRPDQLQSIRYCHSRLPRPTDVLDWVKPT